MYVLLKLRYNHWFPLCGVKKYECQMTAVFQIVFDVPYSGGHFLLKQTYLALHDLPILMPYPLLKILLIDNLLYLRQNINKATNVCFFLSFPYGIPCE